MVRGRAPRRNLPAAAEPWGRYIDQLMTENTNTANALRRDLTTGFKNLSSSLQLVSEQQQRIQSQQNTLTELVSSQVYATHADGFDVGFSLGGSFNNLASATLTFPSWVNQVIVVCTAWISVYADGNGTGPMRARIRPTMGATSGESVSYLASPATSQLRASNTWTALVAPSGGSVSVACEAAEEGSGWFPYDGSNQASVNAVALGVR